MTPQKTKIIKRFETLLHNHINAQSTWITQFLPRGHQSELLDRFIEQCTTFMQATVAQLTDAHEKEVCRRLWPMQTLHGGEVKHILTFVHRKDLIAKLSLVSKEMNGKVLSILSAKECPPLKIFAGLRQRWTTNHECLSPVRPLDDGILVFARRCGRVLLSDSFVSGLLDTLYKSSRIHPNGSSAFFNDFRVLDWLQFLDKHRTINETIKKSLEIIQHEFQNPPFVNQFLACSLFEDERAQTALEQSLAGIALNIWKTSDGPIDEDQLTQTLKLDVVRPIIQSPDFVDRVESWFDAQIGHVASKRIVKRMVVFWNRFLGYNRDEVRKVVHETLVSKTFRNNAGASPKEWNEYGAMLDDLHALGAINGFSCVRFGGSLHFPPVLCPILHDVETCDDESVLSDVFQIITSVADYLGGSLTAKDMKKKETALIVMKGVECEGFRNRLLDHFGLSMG